MGIKTLLWLQALRQELLREVVIYNRPDDLKRLYRVRDLIDRMLKPSVKKMENTWPTR